MDSADVQIKLWRNQMTREEYLSLKSELKTMGNQLRFHKKQLREDQSTNARGLGCSQPIWKTRDTVTEMKQDYRIKHIFMSLLRGKSRVQIENNFESQTPLNGLYSRRDKGLKTLCEKYNLECNVDENYRVIDITRTWIKENAA